jgi:hypothetical protein
MCIPFTPILLCETQHREEMDMVVMPFTFRVQRWIVTEQPWT